MANSIFSAIQGVDWTLSFIETKRVEDSVRVGENNLYTTIFQTFEANTALYFTGEALTASGRQPFSWQTQSVVYLTPLVITLLKQIPGKIRTAMNFCQDNLGSLYQLASAVSAVALYYFGQTALAVPSLVILGIGFLDRKGILPVAMRQLLHRYGAPV